MLPPLWKNLSISHSLPPALDPPLKKQTTWLPVGDLSAHPSVLFSLMMSGTLTKCLSPVYSGMGGTATPTSSRAPPGPSRGRSHPIPDPECPRGSQPPMLETAVLKRPFPLKLCWGHFENPQLLSQKQWPLSCSKWGPPWNWISWAQGPPKSPGCACTAPTCQHMLPIK